MYCISRVLTLNWLCWLTLVRQMRVRWPVSRVLSTPTASRGRWMAIPLGRPLPNASRDRPGRRRGNTAAGCPACRPYLVLLPVGFAVPLPLPVARWALTPPFHPCLAGLPLESGPTRRFVFCGTFPGVAPAGRYPAPCLRGARTFLTATVTRDSAAIQPSDPRP